MMTTDKISLTHLWRHPFKTLREWLLLLALFEISSHVAAVGIPVTENLWIKAVINTVEKGPLEAIWKSGNDSPTVRGDRVIWGYFYASPTDVAWGNENNPEAFVKIWYDVNGRIDVNFFHVSAPDIEVYSSLKESINAGVNTLNQSSRYARHSYRVESSGGVVSGQFSGGTYQTPEAVVSAANRNPFHYSVAVPDLQIGTFIQTVEKGAVNGVWRFGGFGTTTRGDQVTWGFFYANPIDVSWGNIDNPEVYVKIWYDAPSTRIDVNFFHISVPDINTYSGFAGTGYEKGSVTDMRTQRYTRHEYQLATVSEGPPFKNINAFNTYLADHHITPACSTCHAAGMKVIGPSYSAVALYYQGQAEALTKLTKKVMEGGSGVWGHALMIPNPSAKDQVEVLVKWILSLTPEGEAKEEAQREIAAMPTSPSPPSSPLPTYQCAGKTKCSQMTSCAEAQFYLRNCLVLQLDGDGDGIPCEEQWCGH